MIAVNMGSENAPTEPQCWCRFSNLVLRQLPLLLPLRLGGHTRRKGEEHGGVVAMLNMLKADLERKMHEALVEEKDAQSKYETMMADSAEKRTLDSKTLADKEAGKADLEAKSSSWRKKRQPP